MFALIKLMLSFLLFALACGAFVSIVVFAVDVLKWHDKESRVTIQPSNSEAITAQSESNTEESEVISNVESGEHHSPAFSFPRSES